MLSNYLTGISLILTSGALEGRLFFPSIYSGVFLSNDNLI